MRFVELLLIKNKNMESNIQKQMIDIFKYNLRKDARTVSVATLLSQRILPNFTPATVVTAESLPKRSTAQGSIIPPKPAAI